MIEKYTCYKIENSESHKQVFLNESISEDSEDLSRDKLCRVDGTRALILERPPKTFNEASQSQRVFKIRKRKPSIYKLKKLNAVNLNIDLEHISVELNPANNLKKLRLIN